MAPYIRSGTVQVRKKIHRIRATSHKQNAHSLSWQLGIKTENSSRTKNKCINPSLPEPKFIINPSQTHQFSETHWWIFIIELISLQFKARIPHQRRGTPAPITESEKEKKRERSSKVLNRWRRKEKITDSFSGSSHKINKNRIKIQEFPKISTQISN